MIERNAPVVIKMLGNVKQVTIEPIIKKTVQYGSKVCTDEYDIYARLGEWGYEQKTACHLFGVIGKFIMHLPRFSYRAFLLNE